MGLDHEAVRELVGRQARAWEAADPDAIAADFAPDGELVSPAGRWRGQEAIRSAAQAFFAETCDVAVQVRRLVLDGETGALEWSWSETDRVTGRRRTMEDGVIFVLRGDKIVYWREYFDTAEE